MIGLRSIACHVPDERVAVAELAELRELSEQERTNLLGLGIETVSVAPAASTTDLAVAAGRLALDAAGLAPADIDALVSIESRVPEAFMASEATRVQAAIGADRAMTFSVGGLGCVSVTPALMTAAGLLATNPAFHHVLVTHGSKAPAPRRYRHPVTLSGEAGIGIVVARDADIVIRDNTLETNGRYSDLFRVDFRDRAEADWVEVCTDLPTYSFRLAIESRNRFRAMNDALLERHGLAMGDVDHLVMQNLSEGAFRFYEEAFGITFASACRTNMRRNGHLGPIDVLLNLRTAIDAGEIARGARVLVMNASPAAAWSSTLFEVGAASLPASFEL